MLYYALVFLVLGVIAGILQWTGVAAVTAPMSWVLFVTGIVFVAVHMITERPARI
jgi:uncharacterized membrane protein YtjA (UPF0391 family)